MEGLSRIQRIITNYIRTQWVESAVKISYSGDEVVTVSDMVGDTIILTSNVYGDIFEVGGKMLAESDLPHDPDYLQENPELIPGTWVTHPYPGK